MQYTKDNFMQDETQPRENLCALYNQSETQIHYEISFVDETLYLLLCL